MVRAAGSGSLAVSAMSSPPIEVCINKGKSDGAGTSPELRMLDKDLPPASTIARICSYECTFCADCVDNVLFNVCPNCGGGFVPRPIRPAAEWRPGLSMGKRPPSTKRVHLSHSREDIAVHSRRLRDVPSADR